MVAIAKQRITTIYALLVRDAMTRFGHENLGFFWVVGEPLAFTVGIMVIWNIVRQTHGTLSITAFALTAYTMLTMFRHMSQGFVNILKHNAGVQFHSHVTALDILLARGVLETIGCLATFFVAYVPLALLKVIEPIEDPFILLTAWFLGAWFSFSFGLIMESLAEMNETVERITPAIMYLTIPLTGAFTMQAWLPERARDILAYSPLVNVMEMFRNGMFGDNTPTYWSAGYIVFWCTVQTAFGLFLLDHAKKNVQLI